MLITTENEIKSLMPTSRWTEPKKLLQYCEEEEDQVLSPLLGAALHSHLQTEYERLRGVYVDITAVTVKPTGKARQDAQLAHADVTTRLEQIAAGKYRETFTTPEDGERDVPQEDYQTVRLIRKCQTIVFNKMLSHNAGLLTVSFNEGGGLNAVSADGYDEADDKRIERAVKDAYMKAGRAIDDLLLFLENDAKHDRQFTELWQEADTFYLHRDLLFQTARVLNEYLDIRNERMAYVQLVRDIRHCQRTYLKPRIGARLLQAVVAFANDSGLPSRSDVDTSARSDGEADGQTDGTTEAQAAATAETRAAMTELLSLLRTALAFYVESRRTELRTSIIATKNTSNSNNAAVTSKERLARRDSMTDAQQAMAEACQFIEDNIDALGDAAVGTPIYNSIREREAQAAADAAHRCAAEARQRKAACEMQNRKLFTTFPATHRTPELK